MFYIILLLKCKASDYMNSANETHRLCIILWLNQSKRLILLWEFHTSWNCCPWHPLLIWEMGKDFTEIVIQSSHFYWSFSWWCNSKQSLLSFDSYDNSKTSETIITWYQSNLLSHSIKVSHSVWVWLFFNLRYS
jgi:hypothetical protein